MTLTAAQRRALEIVLKHGEGCVQGDGTRCGYPMTPKQFADLMWPDSLGHHRTHKCGYGASRGSAMALVAGGYLGKLRAAGLVGGHTPNGLRRHEIGFYVTAKGQDALAESSTAC